MGFHVERSKEKEVTMSHVSPKELDHTSHRTATLKNRHLTATGRSRLGACADWGGKICGSQKEASNQTVLNARPPAPRPLPQRHVSHVPRRSPTRDHRATPPNSREPP
eukprot:5782281-Prymnesium_polylepis.1